MNILTTIACLVLLLAYVNGHGRLLVPPGRSSLWRVDAYKGIAEINYSDNQLFCGGFSTQTKNEGKCGVCGDSISDPQPRANEAGGKYGKGIITETYESSQTIQVTVDLTAHHKGFFEFRLCKNDDITRIITHECLNKNLLKFDDGNTKFYPQSTGQISLNVILPQDLTCSQCVLQWRYHAGNSWGTDSNGNSGIGLGPQEEFYGCSDIAISDEGDITPPTDSAPPQSSSTITKSTTTMSTTRSKPFFPSTTVSTSTYQPTTTTTTSTTTLENVNLFPDGTCTAEQFRRRHIPVSCDSFVICSWVGYPPSAKINCAPGTVVHATPYFFICDHPYNTPRPCGLLS